MLSVILLSFNSGNKINVSFEKVKSILDQENIPFEFIIVDDGSEDNSFSVALSLEDKNENVRAYQLSRNYTSHYSIFAGLSVCTGDCAVPIPDDEQQPYDLIVKMYRYWEQGNQVVIPFRESREDGIFIRYTSKLFYKLMNLLSDVKFPVGGADSFLIDRELINILNRSIHPINTTTITEVLRLGFNPVYIPYSRPLGINKHKSRWTFRKKMKLAKDTFFSSSSFPIKFITNLGILTAILSFVVLVFYIYVYLFGNKAFWGVLVPGWTSIIVFISFFSGIILISLGIIAEYLWRIYEEVKNRPGYIIRNKHLEKRGKFMEKDK